MMKDDDGWWRMNEEWWRMNDEGWWFQAVEGFWWQTDERTDICDCRVAFASEKVKTVFNPWIMAKKYEIKYF